MKKKIVFMMMLIMAITGSYMYTTNAASNAESTTVPRFTVRPVDQVVPVGGTIQIEVIATGTPTPTVHFYKENQKITEDSRTTITSNKGRTTLTITNATSDDSGKYTIKAINVLGEIQTTCDVTVE